MTVNEFEEQRRELIIEELELRNKQLEAEIEHVKARTAHEKAEAQKFVPQYTNTTEAADRVSNN